MGNLICSKGKGRRPVQRNNRHNKRVHRYSKTGNIWTDRLTLSRGVPGTEVLNNLATSSPTVYKQIVFQLLFCLLLQFFITVTINT